MSHYTVPLAEPVSFLDRFLDRGSAAATPTLIFVRVENEQLGFMLAINLAQYCQDPPTLILVWLPALSGLAGLLPTDETEAHLTGGIHPFGSINETCSLELILHETLDS